MTQEQAMDLLMMGKNVFLTGQAGSGKTYLLNQFIGWLKENKIPAAVTASTGIAATHLRPATARETPELRVSMSRTITVRLRIATRRENNGLSVFSCIAHNPALQKNSIP